MKISKRAKEKFEYFSLCNDSNYITPILQGNYSALESFHNFETYGKYLPCNELILLYRAINGKRNHGITITMLAESYIERTLFADEIKQNYPLWIQYEIYTRAKQLALKSIGFIPTFVETMNDFTTI